MQALPSCCRENESGHAQTGPVTKCQEPGSLAWALPSSGDRESDSRYYLEEEVGEIKRRMKIN